MSWGEPVAGESPAVGVGPRRMGPEAEQRAVCDLAAQLAVEARRAERRRRVGVANRRMAWAVLPVVVAALFLHYVVDDYNAAVWALQAIFVPVVLLHTALSFYVFGWVPPSRTLRTVHIWVGYAYLVAMLASQTTFAWPGLHRVLTVLMFAFLTAHVGIGVHYAVRRRRAAASRVHV